MIHSHIPTLLHLNLSFNRQRILIAVLVSVWRFPTRHLARRRRAQTSSKATSVHHHSITSNFLLPPTSSTDLPLFTSTAEFSCEDFDQALLVNELYLCVSNCRETFRFTASPAQQGLVLVSSNTSSLFPPFPRLCSPLPFCSLRSSRAHQTLSIGK